jgi:hypothetical protein
VAEGVYSGLYKVQHDEPSIESVLVAGHASS